MSDKKNHRRKNRTKSKYIHKRHKKMCQRDEYCPWCKRTREHAINKKLDPEEK